MPRVIKHIVSVLFLCHALLVEGQVGNRLSRQDERFEVHGSVIESDSRAPIPNVNIEVSEGGYTTTDSFGEFRIKVKIGDELIIRHIDFETVYYTIRNNDRIRVEVEPDTDKSSKSPQLKEVSYTDETPFKSLIDSAQVYLKKDAKKSIQFVGDALTESKSVKENSEVYEVLGDIHFYWKQYDLAASNYRISLQSQESNVVKLKLARAYRQNKNYQESLTIYHNIAKRNLSPGQHIELYEGIGDINVQIKKFKEALNAYNLGLNKAKKHLVKPKITDLNSKIAQVYKEEGKVEQAEAYFEKSMQLANTENKKRAVQEKAKVAEFRNETNNFSGEIELRKEVLNELDDIEEDAVLDNESSLTSQKQNYKIGKAYASQSDFNNAIPYLEKSIEEADKKSDLIVQKDATRKLSEVYRDAGQFDKALAAYQDYVELVDKLYIKREQEISQASRLSKDIINKQNRILSLESDRELSQSKYQLSVEQTKRQKLVIYSLIGGVVLLLVAGVFMFKYIKQQRLANNLLALKSLRSQMNPHFIFNALNSVNSFIAMNDERTANKYLTDFSLLMRAVLENSEQDFIPLENELELLKLYVQLEHFRFKDKFDYQIHVDDSIAINDFVIPPMLLQPYIENAVWHGLRYKKQKGILKIAIAQKTTDEIQITISDDGIGRAKSKSLKSEHQKKQNSRGMGNIKKRVSILNNMYKDKVRVLITDLSTHEDVGTKVEVTLKKN
ncbi:histidine kinase [Tamlana fucoidanivorans]|uniref:Tetratricopeptide repeat protein n=1 Tax=Allotamlana fucoidanivorans TaxID=2583814 RepID=A0A5C4SGP0_9FLAO|nr:histidine kinase [Tamlana fucoidanivorans]TNJ41913.1 tetratricopeptide repeat protein [Tamlana fucoidanivorans]